MGWRAAGDVAFSCCYTSTVINVVSFTSLETQLSPLPTHCTGASIARAARAVTQYPHAPPRSGQTAALTEV